MPFPAHTTALCGLAMLMAIILAISGHHKPAIGIGMAALLWWGATEAVLSYMFWSTR